MLYRECNSILEATYTNANASVGLFVFVYATNTAAEYFLPALNIIRATQLFPQSKHTKW